MMKTMTGNLTISSSTGRMFINNGSGSLVMGSWDGANHRIEGASDRKLLITSYHSDGIHLGASGASHVIIKGGNLGIGETSPDKQLHIKDSGNVGISIESTDNAQNLDIDFYNNSGSAAGRIRYAEGPGAFGFAPNVSANDALYITYGGDVGIGTSSPAKLLHVNGQAQFENNIILNENTPALVIPNGDFRIFTGGSETLRISSGRNLKFVAQTTNFESPGFTYHTNNYLYLRGGSSGLILSDDSGINTVQIIDGANGYINFETGDGTSRMRIKHDGKVGIGTITPSATLDVNGTVKLD